MKIYATIIFALLLNIQIRSQGYLNEISTLIENKNYAGSFEFGKKTINNLKASKKQNSYLEFLTWSSYAMHNNLKGNSNGCKILQDFLIKNKVEFKSNNQLLQFKYDTICRKNKPIHTIDIIKNISKKNKIYHKLENDEAIMHAHFKSYMLLKKSVRSTTLFKNLSEDDYNRIANKNLNEGSIDTKEVDSNFVSQMKIISKSKPDSIYFYIKTIYSTENWVKTENFIFVSPFYSKQDLTISADRTEKVLEFYKNQLGLQSPNHFIVVYLSKRYNNVDSDILKFNNIDIHSTIGFTDISSGSIIAWIPGSEQIGTLKHELIHILFENEFKFSPIWFEEGVAMLFEESRFTTTGSLIAINNWRLNFLHALSSTSISSLYDVLLLNNESSLEFVKMEIQHQMIQETKHRLLYNSSYHGSINDLNRFTLYFTNNYVNACKQALIRYILFYLQDQDKLLFILKEIKQNENITIDNYNYMSFVEIFNEATGSDNYQISKQKFIDWLNTQKM